MLPADTACTTHLCSRDCIEHWSGVLIQDPVEIAAVIVTECSDWDVWLQ